MAETLNQQLIEAQNSLSSVSGQLTSTSSALALASKSYNDLKAKRDGGHCANSYKNKNDRKNCQNSLNSQTATALSKANSLAAKKSSLTTQKATLTSRVELLESQIESNIENSSTLAAQGLTSTAIEESAIITANAHAEAIKEQGSASASAISERASVDAENAEEEAEAKSKLTMIIGIVAALVVLGVGAAFIIPKLRK